MPLLPVAPVAPVNDLQLREPLPAVVVSNPPTIDGEIGEGEWQESARREGFFDRDTGLPSDERAEFWLCYDGKNIYFAGRVYTDPKRLVAEEYRQNVSLGGNDQMRLSLDLLGQGTGDDEFGINPQGATEIELNGGRAAKTEWVGEFEAQAKRTENGWQFEARIPWQIVSPAPAGLRDARFDVEWFRSNKSNSYSYAYTRGDRTRNPQWTGVNVPKIEGNDQFLLLPYAFVGAREDSKFESQIGLDFKRQLPGGLNLVGTINPDDVNIENDILSLDFSYFERLAGEARPFFQEGQSYFSTGFDARLFASQRIRHIDSGIKFYGDVDASTRMGAMAVSDFGDQIASVFSLSRRWSPQLVTSLAYVRNDQRGLANDAGQVNVNYSLGDTTYYLNTQFTDDEQQRSGSRISTGAFLETAKWNTGVEYTEVTPNFFPRIGFAPQRNFRQVSLFSRYGEQYTIPGVREWGVGVNLSSANRFNGDFYRDNAGVNAEMSFLNNFGFGIGFNAGRFEQFHDRSFGIGMTYPFNDPYRRVSAEISWSRFRGRERRDLSVQALYRLTPFTQLSLSNEFVEFDGDAETQLVLVATHDLGKYEGVSFRLIRRDNDYNWNASYRLSGRRGTEMFFIVGDPNSRTFTNRLAFKIVTPMTLGF
ncbi:MAG TPA: hypothetical protein PLS15_03925 [Fimbriimonadaceae bacterium]|nr:hypothetical protein [Fimbriimonadaceae bacterium]HRE94796.1 hypothetical protein [Fimbriimonadaceae bacterium]